MGGLLQPVGNGPNHNIAATAAVCRRIGQIAALTIRPRLWFASGGFPRSCDGHRRDLERLLNVCAVQRRRFPVGASPTRRPLQPEATGAVMEVTKWLKPSV